ncbi:unnamed protein product [marine sediment metagenome]|uniref:Dihydroorotate dehydrogenase catalytic domain-containing protein n=1 Tax=marine sediment metagenome TaxID=412755 RepID=X1TSZ5_9ZZZZ
MTKEVGLEVNLGPLHLKNPIMPASGTFDVRCTLLNEKELNRLGAVVPKSIAFKSREGNPEPRTCETDCGAIPIPRATIAILCVFSGILKPLPRGPINSTKSPIFDSARICVPLPTFLKRISNVPELASILKKLNGLFKKSSLIFHLDNITNFPGLASWAICGAFIFIL